MWWYIHTCDDTFTHVMIRSHMWWYVDTVWMHHHVFECKDQTNHKLHIMYRAFHITHPAFHILHPTSHIPHPTSHITHHTSHITHHTSHIAHSTSHLLHDIVFSVRSLTSPHSTSTWVLPKPHSTSTWVQPTTPNVNHHHLKIENDIYNLFDLIILADCGCSSLMSWRLSREDRSWGPHLLSYDILKAEPREPHLFSYDILKAEPREPHLFSYDILKAKPREPHQN